MPDAAAGFMPVGRCGCAARSDARCSPSRRSRRTASRARSSTRDSSKPPSPGAPSSSSAGSARCHVTADAVVLAPDLTAKVVIAADGANSTIRRLLALPQNPPDTCAIAMRGYAADARGPDGSGATHRDGRGGLARIRLVVPDRRAAVPGPGQRRLRHAPLVASTSARERSPDASPCRHARGAAAGAARGSATLRAHALPLSTFRPRQPDGRVLLVGDAASLINPLTGEGIYYAVLSGRLAGEAAVSPGGAAAGALSAGVAPRTRTASRDDDGAFPAVALPRIVRCRPRAREP